MEIFQEFEKEWERYSGTDHIVGCSSGTAALHLALEALALPPKSQVIVPDFTMVACARAVTLAGLTPVFADCSRSSMNVDPIAIDNILMRPGSWDHPPVRAIMAVHIYGRSCNMEAIHELAAKHNLYVIEDLAEAHCTKPHMSTHASCWSFYKNKVVFGEEGGAIGFRHDLESVANRARSLRSLGFTDNHDYWHIPRGHNYRLSNLHAQEILVNFTHMDEWIATRRKQEATYDQVMNPIYKLSPRETPWVYDLQIPGMTTTQQQLIVQRLRAYGIQARHSFKPMSLQPEYCLSSLTTVVSRVVNADRFAREVIYLPLGQSLRMDSDRAAGITAHVIQEVMDGF